MQTTIIATRLPVGATQRTDLEKFFASPSYVLFKEMVAARCVIHQIESMNAGLYPENESATARCEGEKKKAAVVKSLLDVLDDLEKNDQEWFTVKLDCANH